MRVLALVFVAGALATPTQFLVGAQKADGGFAEHGGEASAGLTSWAALGLLAVGHGADGALDYLREHADAPVSPPTRALVAMAAAALGDPAPAAALPTSGGQTNTVIWTILARRQAGLPVPRSLVTLLRARQAANGGWGWGTSVAPDSNDTAAAVQALRAVGAGGAPVRRALAYLGKLRNADGGFGLVPGRASDAQSSAWAIQAYVAAGSRPPRGALAYLTGLRQDDGSYRYSKRYAVTPVWVTAQVLPGVARRPFPLR